MLTAPSGKSYIGISSKSISDRWAKHVEHAKGTREAGALYHAMRKYGHAAFDIRLLVVANNWEYLCDLEKAAILVFNTKSPHGYNISAGGEGAPNRLVTEAERKAHSIAQKTRFQRKDELAKLKSISEYAISCRYGVERKPKWSPPPTCPTFTTKLAQSLAVKQAMSRPDIQGKVKQKAVERANNPEWRTKISVAKKGQGAGRKLPPDQIEKMREARKAWWERKKAAKNAGI